MIQADWKSLTMSRFCLLTTILAISVAFLMEKRQRGKAEQEYVLFLALDSGIDTR